MLLQLKIYSGLNSFQSVNVTGNRFCVKNSDQVTLMVIIKKSLAYGEGFWTLN